MYDMKIYLHENVELPVQSQLRNMVLKGYWSLYSIQVSKMQKFGLRTYLLLI